VALLSEARTDLPQCDELCGPFWAAVALRAAGFPATQEDAALAAGSVLAPPGSPSSLPPGETGRQPSVALPVGEPAGTSAHGVARAVEVLSGGRLSAVPASGDPTAAQLLDLLARVDDPVIANVDTAALWDPSVTEQQVERYVRTGEDTGPDNAWRVGHFLAIAEARAPLLVLADSYPSRATHVQPAERVARALRGRGLLVITAAASAVREAVEASGLAAELWDNGSPQP
jgi:uncharacterized protein DUF6885